MSEMSSDDRAELEQCIAEKGLRRGDHASMLSAARIPAGGKRALWFVRPTSEPFCLALYGAHLFRYFLVEERQLPSVPSFRLVFQNGGDRFAIHRRLSHGLNDIEATGCVATECRSVRMSFDGRRYRPISCTYSTFDRNGREIVRKRQCGSDDWRDDQASGLRSLSGR